MAKKRDSGLAQGKKIQVEISGYSKPLTGEPPPTQVTLARTPVDFTDDQALWTAIRNRCNAIGFERYDDHIKRVFCLEDADVPGKVQQFRNNLLAAHQLNVAFDARLSIHAADSFNVLRLATEIFLLIECGIVDIRPPADQPEALNKVTTLKDPDLSGFDKNDPGKASEEESLRYAQSVNLEKVESLLTSYFSGNDKLPYLKSILRKLLGNDEREWIEKLPFCVGVLKHRFSCPSMLELIWSYWHEEGLLVQTMNAIALRFQNRRSTDRDPLAHFELDPLRPLNNLLWGYIQNEHNRLTMPRRAYEYDHHYGITLYGKAVPKLRSADSRSKFLQAFHNLLLRSTQFFRQDADTTVVAEGFPLLNALKEVHLVLAEGAHNQFGDLPWTARVEMLIEQWLLSRPELHEFLRRRHMVPYEEDWMGAVDAMKKLQDWGDVSVTHYHDLARFGEQLLLTLRYGAWNTVTNEDNAKNWARYWKPEIQGYIHAYRVTTGQDLTREPVDATPPWVHFKRQEEQRRARV